MKEIKLRILISILIFCMILNNPTPQTNSKNKNQIKSSDEDYTNITMENINDTSLKFSIDSSRDVTAFRLFYITNHTNGSSFFTEFGGMGDILGLDILPSKLRFSMVTIKYLYLYQNGGYLYTFLMDVYSINPLDEERVYAGQIELEPYPPVIIIPDPIDENGDDDPDPTDEGDQNSVWLWIIVIVIILGFGVLGFFRPNRNDNRSPSDEGEFSGETLNPQSADALERRRMRVRANKNARNN